MNRDDKKALVAFKSMFAALSSSVRKKYEGKSRENAPTIHKTVVTLAPVIEPSPGEGFVRFVVWNPSVGHRGLEAAHAFPFDSEPSTSP